MDFFFKPKGVAVIGATGKLLKGGKSAGGARAAMSHTASMTGNVQVIRGALKQVGVVEAHDFQQMADIAKAMAMYPAKEAQSRGWVPILTFSGAAGIVSTDMMSERDLKLAKLSEDTIEALKRVYPEWMPPSNPVDLWPAIERSGAQRAYGEAVKAICADPGVDALVLHLFIGGVAGRELDISYLAQVAGEAGKPIFIWALGKRKELRDFMVMTQQIGVPTYREIGRVIDAMAAVLS